MSASPSPSHIIIVGGGLAGPALALALAPHGIRSTILELRSEPGNSGGALMIAPNALKVFDGVLGHGLSETIRKEGFEVDRIGFYDDSARFFGGIEMSIPGLGSNTQMSNGNSKSEASSQSHSGREEDAPSRIDMELDGIADPKLPGDHQSATNVHGAQKAHTEGESRERGQRITTVRILRTKLHQALLNRCATYPNLIEIRYGAKWTDIEENEEEVSVLLEDGGRVRGDILAGCDGIHSKVRSHVLGSSAPTPTYSGLAGLGSSLPRSSLNVPSTLSFPAFLYSQYGMIMFVPTDPSGTEIGWAVQRTEPERDREGWLVYQNSGEAASNIKNDYKGTAVEPIRSLMEHLDDQTEVRLWAPYQIPELPTWHTARVCLIGDAAHAIPPSGGQGSAMAFEDAGYLARLLVARSKTSTGASAGSMKSFTDLFEHFEHTRKKRIEVIRQLTQTSGDLRRTSGLWVGWVLKKWATRLYFWWKGGWLRQDAITGYDLMRESVEY